MAFQFRAYSYIALLLFVVLACNSQMPIGPHQKPGVSNKEFAKTIDKYLDFSTPVIGVDSLIRNYEKYLILDARSLEEYNLSHLPGALYIGYHKPQWEVLDTIDKNKEILVYCSIGYRSEKITEKLIKKGFNATNLYGSLFEWVNRNQIIFDENGTPTKKVHGYSRSWSKWIENDSILVSY